MPKYFMQKITPHLWFDKQAKEAAAFYVEVFGQGSKVTSVHQLHDTPSGDVDTVTFNLLGENFMAISAGPYFKFNPAVSFMVNFDPSRDSGAKERLQAAWEKLVQGGQVLMELGRYDFSELYGWVQDKYGLSWQLILTNPNGEPRPNIMPSLLFTQSLAGRAEEASEYYLSVFAGKGETRRGALVKYPESNSAEKPGSVMFTDFELAGKWFVAMDSALGHKFIFNEAVSFMVSCKDQVEIDYFWEKLSKDPKAEQCGWCKDQFGVSWQIVPEAMNEMMGKGTPEQQKRLTEAFLKMKKFDIQKLEEAFNS